MSQLDEKLFRILRPEQIRLHEPMSRHTTFRTGGPADWFVEPEQWSELADVLAVCREEHVPYYILGNGSNLLVGDRGYRGVMVALGAPLAAMTADGRRIRAGAGASLAALARLALEQGLGGLEFASGIPGSVGGAVVMNAGAYGSEICQVLRAVTLLTPEGEIRECRAEELELGYRASCIPRRGFVVLDALFELEPGDPEEIRARMEDLAARRREKQPLQFPSAGSTFKRPPGYFAGRLIDEAGLKGFSVGGAQVSEKHGGFVINRHQATSEDILTLCREVQGRVRERYGVELELEVKLVGEF
ncbi:MAG: UDP-N-acetylmuramate dehydrogenase [Clostridiales bacterium]|nr:UDP-N-acetylmuramate dehydrogenase [Clostridiales bacterium]